MLIEKKEYKIQLIKGDLFFQKEKDSTKICNKKSNNGDMKYQVMLSKP
jgi:hypothetical protein